MKMRFFLQRSLVLLNYGTATEVIGPWLIQDWDLQTQLGPEWGPTFTGGFGGGIFFKQLTSKYKTFSETRPRPWIALPASLHISWSSCLVNTSAGFKMSDLFNGPPSAENARTTSVFLF